MMIQDTTIITAPIYVLGSTTVVLSLMVAFAFVSESARINKPDTKKLTSALAWQLAGEATIGMGALAFAYAAHTGSLEDWTVLQQSLLLFGMFVATSVTTAHLYLTVRSLR